MADEIQLNVPSAHARYLEEALDSDREAPTFLQSVNPGDSEVVSEDGYVGTDPIYQNHANDTEAPYQADEGPDKLAEEAYVNALEGEATEAGERLKENYDAISRAEAPTEVPAEAPKAPAKAATKK